jgi:hypothetical protein
VRPVSNRRSHSRISGGLKSLEASEDTLVQPLIELFHAMKLNVVAPVGTKSKQGDAVPNLVQGDTEICCDLQLLVEGPRRTRLTLAG